MLDLVLAFTHVFCPGTRLYSRLGGTGPKCTPAASGLFFSFGAQFSFWGDTSSDLGGARPRNAPKCAGPVSSHFREKIKFN